MDTSTFVARRRTLRKNVADGAILIMGNDEAPINYTDNVYPFRQDSHFLYFLGISQANLAALIEPDGSETLFGVPDSAEDVVWFGEHPTLADHAAEAGVARYAAFAGLGARLSELRSKGVRVHYLPPYRAQRILSLAELFAIDSRAAAEGYSAELVRAVAAQREVKEPAEIAEIEEALSVTAEAYRLAMQAARPGRSEAEIAAILQGPALARDRRQAFNPIVSVRGEVLHNTSYANTLSDGDLLLIDSGADSARFYASDVTRTMPVSGRFAKQQRDVYEIVLAAQSAAIAAAAPGVNNRELHFIAARTIATGLKDLGLMRGEVEAAVEAGAHALFFPHGLGHMLGQDVHDMEDLGDVVGYPEGEARSTQFGLAYLRLARELAPNWVITVEPGIYFIPALIDAWRSGGRHSEFIDYERIDAFRSFGGIRIEDDVVITADGCRVLGPAIPKTVEEVEAAMGGE
jgi:Xaa-Pro aminopeptidase